MFKHTLFSFLFLCISQLAIAAPPVTITGSTSVSHVMEVIAERYQRDHDVVIQVQGTGSAAGIAAVKQGIAPMGMSSRYLKQEEMAPDLTTDILAYDGIALVVHPSNPVTALTQAQIRKIYLGEIKNWQALGGADREIAAVSRESASGSRFSFETLLDLTKVVKGETVSGVSPRLMVVNSNSMVKTLVAKNPHAIGYVSLGSVDAGIKPLSVDGQAPTLAAIADGRYKLARPFVILRKTAPLSSAANGFYDYLLSEQGQQAFANAGYVASQSQHMALTTP
jgi:phosphate transport system substrate-binding protein